LHLSTPMSLARMWSDPYLDTQPADEPGDLDEIVGLGGMSCDGALSCSAQLVISFEKLQRDDAKRSAPAPSGPMCLPGSPDCTLTPGVPSNSHMVELSHPLVPYVEDATPDIDALADGELQSRRHAGEQRLHGRETHHRLDRPPRA